MQTLLRHVVPGTFFRAGISDQQKLFTAGGNTPGDIVTFTVSADIFILLQSHSFIL